MDFNFGRVISASLLLVIVRSEPGSHSCTRFADLADPCGCTLSKDNFDPICGEDGNTYLNRCFLECQQTIDSGEIRVQHKGICSRESQCLCKAGYAPVCGNNGVTYPNDCVLNCNIKKDQSIKLKHRGSCADGDPRDTRLRSEIRKCYCNPANGPICASDGVTYFNACVMRCKNKYTNPTVTFKYWGECESDDESDNDSFEDVILQPWLKDKSEKCRCGVDSVTYYSRCGNTYSRPKCFCQPKVKKMKKMKLCNENSNQYRPGTEEKENLQLSVTNTCFCAALNQPVCANNHETYTNTCVLHCHAKKDPSIKFERWGTCGKVRLVSRLKKKEEEAIEYEDTLLRTQKIKVKSMRNRKG